MKSWNNGRTAFYRKDFIVLFRAPSARLAFTATAAAIPVGLITTGMFIHAIFAPTPPPAHADGFGTAPATAAPHQAAPTRAPRKPPRTPQVHRTTPASARTSQAPTAAPTPSRTPPPTEGTPTPAHSSPAPTASTP